MRTFCWPDVDPLATFDISLRSDFKYSTSSISPSLSSLLRDPTSLVFIAFAKIERLEEFKTLFVGFEETCLMVIKTTSPAPREALLGLSSNCTLLASLSSNVSKDDRGVDTTCEVKDDASTATVDILSVSVTNCLVGSPSTTLLSQPCNSIFIA
jgi:hypothetical protein